MHKRNYLNYILSLTVVATSMTFISPQKVLAASSERLAGNDRYSTSVKISQAGWSSSQNVVLATGEDFPDALCAAPLAKKLDAPILLAQKSGLSSVIETELNRLGVRNIYIIGGTGVISKTIEDKLVQKGITVKRLSGNDRYQTSIAVANYMNSRFTMGKEIVVATGDSFPDALSIAPVAASKGMPIILSPKTSLPAQVKSYITQKGITKSYMVGGTGVLSNKVKQELPGAERMSGNDRYETNAAVMNRFASEINFSKPYIATGEDFPDALAGSALAPKTSAPIILTNRSVPKSTSDFVYSKLKEINTVVALGGEGAVPYSALEGIYFNHFRGNTPGNIVNGGIAAIDEGTIYYANNTFDVIKSDGTERRVFWDTDIPMFINAQGDWLYYFNVNDQGKLYKINKNGTGRTVMSNDMAQFINVVGEWVYYSNGSEDGNLYKMKIDGTGRIKLTDDYASDVNVSGGYIYYSRGIFEKELYKVKTDGTGTVKLSADVVESVNVVGDWIYYRNISADSKIYKIKTDGTGRQEVVGDPALFVNVSDGWIYYSNHSKEGQLYKVRTDGTGKVMVTGDQPVFINVVGGFIYYVSTKDEMLYRVRTNGMDRQAIY